jgi:hypothetical protein
LSEIIGIAIKVQVMVLQDLMVVGAVIGIFLMFIFEKPLKI